MYFQLSKCVFRKRMFFKKISHNLKVARFINNSALLSNVEKKIPKKQLKALVSDAASFEERNPLSDKWLSSPYPANTRSQQSPLRPNVDPATTSVLLFPGQGSQFVGMGKDVLDFPNVINMFEAASEILRYNLLDLCTHGPKDMLNMTSHAQVAVMVTSLAAVERLRAENPKAIENCVGTAGFSVGEYAALVFAGSLEFEDAVRLLKIRGDAMQAASDMQSSGMMTVFLDIMATIKNACKCARESCEKQGIENAECTVAIDLFPHCKVVSGHMEALNYLELKGTRYGIKRVKYLEVSGAFHSNLMLPAKRVLEKALKTTIIETPLIPVYSNLTAKPYRTPEQIRTSLAKQLHEPVKWEQTMHSMFERDKGIEFPETYECGPGTSLKSILHMCNGLAYNKCTKIMV